MICQSRNLEAIKLEIRMLQSQIQVLQENMNLPINNGIGLNEERELSKLIKDLSAQESKLQAVIARRTKVTRTLRILIIRIA